MSEELSLKVDFIERSLAGPLVEQYVPSGNILTLSRVGPMPSPVGVNIGSMVMIDLTSRGTIQSVDVFLLSKIGLKPRSLAVTTQEYQDVGIRPNVSYMDEDDARLSMTVYDKKMAILFGRRGAETSVRVGPSVLFLLGEGELRGFEVDLSRLL